MYDEESALKTLGLTACLISFGLCILFLSGRIKPLDTPQQEPVQRIYTPG